MTCPACAGTFDKWTHTVCALWGGLCHLCEVHPRGCTWFACAFYCVNTPFCEYSIYPGGHRWEFGLFIIFGYEQRCSFLHVSFGERIYSFLYLEMELLLLSPIRNCHILKMWLVHGRSTDALLEFQWLILSRILTLLVFNFSHSCGCGLICIP